MKTIALISIFGTMFFAAAGANAQTWVSRTGEDPLDDTKTAVVSQLQQSGGLQPFVLGAKCWEGRPNSTALMLGSPMPYDQSASYKDEVRVVFRVDKNEKITMPLSIRELGGRVSFVTTAGDDDNVLKLLAQIAAAKDRIGIGVEDSVLTFPAKGSTKAFGTFMKACGITFSPSS